MSDFGIVFDERFKQHDPGENIPERPDRLDAVRAALEWNGALTAAVRIDPRPASDDEIARIHAPDYFRRIEAACRDGACVADCPDVGICPASAEIARLAAGGVIEAAGRVAGGELQRVFCAVRPPGHHAEHNRAMGFCLLNNAALAAAALRAAGEIERVLIVDWDVHHGNGTQHAFESEPSVLFISLHEHPEYQYPGTGYAYETGQGAGQGATINIPFLPGAEDDDYRRAFEQQVLPAAYAFAPQCVLISAGFDAHADDPLGHLKLSDFIFGWMLRELIAVADRHAAGRLISVLEGGYDLNVLRRCVHDHVDLLHG